MPGDTDRAAQATLTLGRPFRFTRTLENTMSPKDLREQNLLDTIVMIIVAGMLILSVIDMTAGTNFTGVHDGESMSQSRDW